MLVTFSPKKKLLFAKNCKILHCPQISITDSLARLATNLSFFHQILICGNLRRTQTNIILRNTERWVLSMKSISSWRFELSNYSYLNYGQTTEKLKRSEEKAYKRVGKILIRCRTNKVFHIYSRSSGQSWPAGNAMTFGKISSLSKRLESWLAYKNGILRVSPG